MIPLCFKIWRGKFVRKEKEDIKGTRDVKEEWELLGTASFRWWKGLEMEGGGIHDVLNVPVATEL